MQKTTCNGFEIEEDNSGFKRLSKTNTSNKTLLDKKTLLQHEVERVNSIKGSNKYFDCPKCKNRSFIAFIDEEKMRVVYRSCECHNKVVVYEQLDRLGIYEFSKNATFENYQTNTEWQAKSKKLAINFANNHNKKWFFIGGEVGCGKTHLCTAIVTSILENNPYTTINYFKWDDSFDDLINNDSYGCLIDDLKQCDVLYLDDFLRPITSNIPRYLEIRKAKELLDYRYMNKKTTIISSELNLDQILEIDEAIGSRITEMSKGSRVVYVANEKYERNVRLHPELIKKTDQ